MPTAGVTKKNSWLLPTANMNEIREKLMKTSRAKKIKVDKSETSNTFIREVRATYHMTETQPFIITGPEDAAAFVRSILTDNSREHFVALYLDGAHQVVSYSTISIGTANASIVHPREVFQRAILAGAISLVVAHNHPSGNLTPSEEDYKVTKRLKEAGDVIGIRLLDHLIISDVANVSIIDHR